MLHSVWFVDKLNNGRNLHFTDIKTILLRVNEEIWLDFNIEQIGSLFVYRWKKHRDLQFHWKLFYSKIDF